MLKSLSLLLRLYCESQSGTLLAFLRPTYISLYLSISISLYLYISIYIYIYYPNKHLHVYLVSLTTVMFNSCNFNSFQNKLLTPSLYLCCHNTVFILTPTPLVLSNLLSPCLPVLHNAENSDAVFWVRHP